MAIIGNIDGLPIYDSKEEALVWGKHNGLTGYHTHNMNGKVGYMGGDDHSKAVQILSKTTTSTSSSGY
jgi:hypothetical protein